MKGIRSKKLGNKKISPKILLAYGKNPQTDSERELEILTKKAKSGVIKFRPKHKISRSKFFTLASIIVLIICILVIVFNESENRKRSGIVTNFIECSRAEGSTILESDPQTCITKDNLMFTDIQNENN